MVLSLIFHTKRLPSNIATFVLFPIWLLVTSYFLKRKAQTFSDIGLKDPVFSALKRFFVGGFLATGIISMVFVLSAFQSLISIKSIGTGLVAVGFLTLAFFGTFLQAGAEEIIFRGYILNSLLKKGTWLAVISSSLLFSILHLYQGLNILGLVNIFLFGVLAAQLFLNHRNIWASIGFHVIWNFLQANIYGFAVYGMFDDIRLLIIKKPVTSFISGGAYGPEASLITTLLLFISIGIFFIIPRVNSYLP